LMGTQNNVSFLYFIILFPSPQFCYGILYNQIKPCQQKATGKRIQIYHELRKDRIYRALHEQYATNV